MVKTYMAEWLSSNEEGGFTMKADYKNWMPKGMVASFTGGAVAAWIVALGSHMLMHEGTVKRAVTGLSATAGVVLLGCPSGLI